MTKTEKIIEVELDKITPDPDQPRKSFPENELKGLAGSLKKEDQINPIEIDDNYVIITGERRWRASKLAGLKTVKVRINHKPMSEYERLRHQMAENEHQSGGRPMNPIDRANAYKKMLEIKGHKLPIRSEVKQGRDLGISELARDLVIPADTIGRLLRLLYESKKMQEEIIKAFHENEYGKGWTLIDLINRAPKEIKGKLKRKYIKGEFKSREEIRNIIVTANTDLDEAEIEMNRKRLKESTSANNLLNGTAKFGMILRNNPIKALSRAEADMVRNRLEALKVKIDTYLAIAIEGEVVSHD